MKTAAIYARSTKDRSDISTKTQVHELTTFASSRSLKVVRAFEDAEETGKTDDRPAFGELARAIKNPKRGWDTLLVYDTSRIARRRYIAQAFKHLARKAGVTILYLRIPADLDPVAEVVLESVFEAMDEAHSLMSRDKALAGMRENVRRGWRAGGRAPLGYQLEKVATGAVREGEPVTKTRLVPSPDAPKVAEYLRRRATGEPRLKVLRELGLDWKPNSMVDLERRALMYAGHMVWNQHSNGRLLPREQWQVQRDAHPALIGEAEAEAVMRQLQTGVGAKIAASMREASAALLSGLLYAPDGRRWRSNGRVYRLEGKPSRSIPRAEFDAAVTGAVMEKLAEPQFVEGLIDASRKRAPDDGPRQRIIKETGRLTRERDRAARLALETDDEVYTGLVRERSQQIAGLQRELASMAEDDAVTRALKEITPAAFRDALEGKDPSEIVQALVQRVVLGTDLEDCTIEYRSVAASSRAEVMASPRGCHSFGTLEPAIVLPLRARA
jgi:site-specific DNA recombinase